MRCMVYVLQVIRGIAFRLLVPTVPWALFRSELTMLFLSTLVAVFCLCQDPCVGKEGRKRSQI